MSFCGESEQKLYKSELKMCPKRQPFSLNFHPAGCQSGEALISPIVSQKTKKNFGFDQIDGKAAERIFYLNWNNFILLLSFPTGCRGLSFTEGRKWLLWRTLLLDSGSFDPPSARNKHHGTHIHFKGPSDLFETSISFQVLENLQVF